MQILEPVKGRFTEGYAGLHLGDFSAHYGEASAHMEAFSRMLWGLAPLWSQGGGGDYLPLFRQGLVNGTDPDHPGYWGRPFDCDQKVVEMAAIATTLLLCGEQLDFTPREAENLHAWLAGVEGLRLPQNNWLFFRVLVETYGTGKVAEDKIAQIVRENFDLRPGKIISYLDLRRPKVGS